MLARYLQRIRELGLHGLHEVFVKRQRKKALSSRWKKYEFVQKQDVILDSPKGKSGMTSCLFEKLF